jgi:hypothetical protein
LKGNKSLEFQVYVASDTTTNIHGREVDFFQVPLLPPKRVVFNCQKSRSIRLPSHMEAMSISVIELTSFPIFIFSGSR